MYPGIVAKAEKEKKLREAAKAKSERLAKIRRIQQGAEPSAKGWRSAPAPVPPSRSRSRSRSSIKQEVSDQEKNLADLKEEVVGLDREHRLRSTAHQLSVRAALKTGWSFGRVANNLCRRLVDDDTTLPDLALDERPSNFQRTSCTDTSQRMFMMSDCM